MPEIPDRLAAALADRYTLERELGAGGMATVYLARDLRHDRLVAIKVLRPELGAVIGAERFLSEIKTTANLQHPHILPLHDSGEAAGLLWYAMPYVEGESLRDRLVREKQLPVGEAVRIATEVAGALDFAHRRGVVHRDIKPENVLLQDGRALVADFGIALAASKAGGTRMTETGMSLGTPHYMSPEQAMGERELDARSDIYALGAMTYELLAGEPPFTGPTAQAIVAKVMTAEPEPVTSYRKTVPPNVAAAVATALQKLPADRFPTAAAYAEALANPTYRGAGVGPSRRAAGPPSRLTAALAAVAFLAAAAAAWGWLRDSRQAVAVAPSSHLALLAPELGGTSTSLLRQLAITPDGSTIYYGADVEAGLARTLRQRLDEQAPTDAPIDRAAAGYRISPDGQWMYAVRATDGATQRYRLGSGGGAMPVPYRVSDAWTSYAAWGSDGTLWLSNGISREGIVRIAPDGQVTTLPVDTDALVLMQVIDARTLLMIRIRLGNTTGPVYLVDGATGTSTRLLDREVVEARYGGGYLVYVLASGDMEALAFNPQTRALSGQPVRIATDVSLTGTGIAQFDVALNGTVAYMPEEPRSLVLVDRDGASRPAIPDRHNFHSPRFSRDGQRVAVDFSTTEGRDVWVVELESRLLSRVTFARDGHDPSWAPDGAITFITAGDGVLGALKVRPGSTAPPDSLVRDPVLGWTGDWLADGSALLTVAQNLSDGGSTDIGLVQNRGMGPIEPLLATRASEAFPALSPDNAWFAFTSTQSGREEVYVRRLDGSGVQLQVSARGGTEPAWSRDGKELFYRTYDAEPELMAATLALGPTPAVLERTPLFNVAHYATATPHANYDVSPDGRQFVMVQTNPSARIMVIQNLPALVARLRGVAP